MTITGCPAIPSEKEKRLRIYRLHPRVLLQIFNWNQCGNEYVQLPVLPDPVPADAEVLHIQTAFNPYCIEMLVYHPSFDEIPLGDSLPIHPLMRADLTARRVELK